MRERTHTLLLNTLPVPIVQLIAAGSVRTVSRYECASVLQCDLVGFTRLSSEYTPQQVVDFLSELFEAFDELADRFGADKVKTIGDAYVVCAGALSPCETHEATMATIGLCMVEAVAAQSRACGLEVGARIGIHTGLLMGGIIGTVKFHFDMWGNGIAGAMQMEEMGATGRVHVSDATRDGLLRGAHGEEFLCTVGQELTHEQAAETGIARSFFVEPAPEAEPEAPAADAAAAGGDAERGSSASSRGGGGGGGSGGQGGGGGGGGGEPGACILRTPRRDRRRTARRRRRRRR